MREFLQGLELGKEMIDTIMAEHGKLVTKDKEEIDNLKTQVENANKEIQSYKDMDIDSIKQSASDWETKYNTLIEEQKEAKEKAVRDERIANFFKDVKFASESAKAGVIAQFNEKDFKYDTETETFQGGSEWLKNLQEKDTGAFLSDVANPKFTTTPTAPTVTSTNDEFRKFIEQEKELKYKAFFEMLYFLGLRKGEANALNWKDINFEKKEVKITKSVSLKIKGEKYVIIPPKTKTSNRILPLPDIVINDLRELYNDYKKYTNFENNWFVFGGVFPLSDTTIENHNIQNAKLAGIKKIRIHDLRHSCASLLINNGATINLVSKYLGHNDITTTLNTYTHLFKNQFSDITNLINKL